MRKQRWKAVLLWTLVFSFLFTTAPIRSAAKTTLADRVYINGTILTMETGYPTASAIAIKGQLLIYVGDDEGVKQFIGNNTKVMDLKGKTVIPKTAIQPEEVVSKAGTIKVEALKDFLAWAAYSQFRNEHRGSLKAGKLANFVVVDSDYLKYPANEVGSLQVHMTILRGEEV